MNQHPQKTVSFTLLTDPFVDGVGRGGAFLEPPKQILHPADAGKGFHEASSAYWAPANGPVGCGDGTGVNVLFRLLRAENVLVPSREAVEDTRHHPERTPPIIRLLYRGRCVVCVWRRGWGA